MPAVPEGPLTREQAAGVAAVLRERLVRQVALEVWTRRESGIVTGDRDVSAHAEEARALMQQLKTLHPALTLTPYDLDQHAAGAAERGIEHAPTVIMRCAGRSIRTVGLFFGPFFQSLLDELGFLSVGDTPLDANSKAYLRNLEADVTIEAFLTPFDPISVRMIPLLGALAVEGRRVRVTQYEASQFPVLAARRLVSQVPLLVINGQRFLGHYTEAQLIEQIRRVVEGIEEPLVRERVWATPYVSEEDARRMGEQEAARRQSGQQPGQTPPPSGGPPAGPGAGGLYIPGRG